MGIVLSYLLGSIHYQNDVGVTISRRCLGLLLSLKQIYLDLQILRLLVVIFLVKLVCLVRCLEQFLSGGCDSSIGSVSRWRHGFYVK